MVKRKEGHFSDRLFLGFSCFVIALTAALMIPGLSTVSSAAGLQHTKATASDVKQRGLTTMKGVQGTEITTGSNPASLTEENLDYCLLNVDISQIIAHGTNGTPYEYQGNTYYFDDSQGSVLKVLEKRIKEYREQGVSWCFNIVMSYRSDLTYLYYNPTPGKIYYALNVNDENALRHFGATLHFMAREFGYSDTFVQDWRIGNEVNVSHDYNYTGLTSNLTTNLAYIAAQGYLQLEAALKDENPNAKAYVSVTHDWNNDNEGKGAPTKDFLDSFNAIVGSDDNWGIDFHAYPPQMKVQVWSRDCAQYLKHDVSTKFICAPNLEVLTDYVKQNFGSNHRLIMTEQSFDSQYGEEEQAAMIAYTYYAGVNNDLCDSVIFTCWKDTGSSYHDFYDMGFITIDGRKKASFDVFKYMDTDSRSTYVDPYLSKLSGWTGRTISSWSDDILYHYPATDAVLTYASLNYPENEQKEGQIYIGMSTAPDNRAIDIEYKWEAYNSTTQQWQQVQNWTLDNEWLKWTPDRSGNYLIVCTARVAGNPSSVMQASRVVGFGDPITYQDVDIEYPLKGTSVTNSDGYTIFRDADNNVTCKDPSGNLVKDNFISDGTYTYYFQKDGTAMKDRLTYHPDGEHIIYLDSFGHEVFSNFHSVKASIAGDPVSDWCFFNVYGYMYVNTVTYDKEGKNLYYANPYGVLERGGNWFKFDDNAMYGDSGQKWELTTDAKMGFANSDGTLMTNAYSYDWMGRYIYFQANGEASWPFGY